MSAFTLKEGLLVFTDDQPGSHVTLFGARGKFAFRGDASTFDDKAKSYTWAFDCEAFDDGDRFVFATADRTVVGQVKEGEVQVLDVLVDIEREPGTGKPLFLRAPFFPPIAPRASAIPASSVKVTIITCSYNRPEMLRAAIESVRNQTDPNWEHLIYDDGSTNSEIEKVLTWAEEDPRTRVWRDKANHDKPSMVWNHMFDRARGRYLSVLDDDNEKLPQFVEVLSAELDADPSLDLVTCGWVVLRPDGAKETDYHLNLSTGPSVLQEKSTCDGGAMLYRRELFERAGYFSEALRTNEDWDWLRRAIDVATKYKNLHECYATYRSHESNRMLRCQDLGNDRDVKSVRARSLKATLGVQLVRPALSRLTRSQDDVSSNIIRAIAATPWVARGDDLAVVISPFQLSDEEIAGATVSKVTGAQCQRVLSLHMEDPYALATNLERVRGMVSRCGEVWVCTNDVSTVSHYRQIVGDRVIVCPLLGADLLKAFNVLQPDDQDRDILHHRDIDALLCGYAYPSRKRFVDELLPAIGDKKIVLLGDGWESYKEEGRVAAIPTSDLVTTYKVHARAKTVICLHRVHGDCSDGPVEPATANRGFMEGFFGPRVFLDESRRDHTFDEGDVVWYESPRDLAMKLRVYLDGERDVAAERFAEKCALLYTYRARVARILNCVRSPRFLARIP